MSKTLNVSQKIASQEYDRLYAEGKRLIEEVNPCNFVKTADGFVLCRGGIPCCTNYDIDMRWGTRHEYRPIGPSAHPCTHLGQRGCTVKALTCKLYLCPDLKKAFPKLDAKLAKLREQMREIGFSGIRMSKREHLLKIKGLAR